jgi:hypothetical protein
MRFCISLRRRRSAGNAGLIRHRSGVADYVRAKGS